jgi:protein involved in polysaccharide export with SLBB domain
LKYIAAFDPMKYPSTFLLVLVATLAAGCLSLLAQTNVGPSSARFSATNAAAALPSAETFRLGPADKLTYWLEDDPVKGAEADLISVNALGNASFRVTRSSDLTITLNVAGKSLAEVTRDLKQKLDADYYQDARVKLELKETTPRFGQVLFIGRGTRGNVLQLAAGEEKRIFEAVFQVGINEWANLKKVKLVRVDPITQKTETRVVDLEEIRKGNRTNNLILRNGDIIDVPEKVFNFGE